MNDDNIKKNKPKANSIMAYFKVIVQDMFYKKKGKKARDDDSDNDDDGDDDDSNSPSLRQKDGDGSGDESEGDDPDEKLDNDMVELLSGLGIDVRKDEFDRFEDKLSDGDVKADSDDEKVCFLSFFKSQTCTNNHDITPRAIYKTKGMDLLQITVMT